MTAIVMTRTDTMPGYNHELDEVHTPSRYFCFFLLFVFPWEVHCAFTSCCVPNHVLFLLLSAVGLFACSETVSPLAASVRSAMAIRRLWIITTPDSFDRGQPTDLSGQNLPDFLHIPGCNLGTPPPGYVQPDMNRRLLAELAGQP